MADTAPKTRYGIPVGPDGYVPEAELIKHFNTVMARKQREYDAKREERAMEVALGISDKGRMPRMNIAKVDYDSRSDIVIPLKCTPEQVAMWWHDPTCCDVQDIDTSGPPKVNIPSGMTPEQKRDQGRIKVIATPSEEAKFRRELVATYSSEDIRKFAATSPTVAIKPTAVGNSGRYIPISNRIELDRRDGLNQGTIAHEGGHHLRHTDPDRRDVMTKANPIIGIEESCTVAEQMARSDKPDYTGYYMDVAVYDHQKHHWRKPTISEARRMAEEDHALFTYGRGKGLKGDDALESVRRNWTSSHISRLWTSNGLAVNAMANLYGNVDRISMAQSRIKADITKDAPKKDTIITNATAGRPGVAETANTKAKTKQTTLFMRRCRA